MATCGDALAPTRAAARTERLESLLRAHLTRLAAHPDDLAVRREARAISRELKRRGEPAVNRGLEAAAKARAKLLTLDRVDPARTLDACEAVLALDPDEVVALRLLACAAHAAGLSQVVAWATADLRSVVGEQRAACEPRVAALVGSSRAMALARLKLSVALDSDEPVLLLGEPGTGKRLAAETLHAGRSARGCPFQTLSANLPEATLERKLFGHGCDAGALEQSGTLLITDAQRLSPLLQARLARAIRTREVQRGGASTAIPAKVPRLVLAAPPLATAWPGPFVVDGLARALLPVELPPLRERPEDIAPLAAHLLQGVRSRDGHPLRLRQVALEAFMRHTWPGNVAELGEALRVLVKRHRWRRLDEPERVPADRAHPVEAVHAALTAALDHLFDSVADEAPARDDLAERVVAGVATSDAGALARALVGVAERLGARWVALWRVDEGGRATVVQLGDRALADPTHAQAQVFEPAPAGSVVDRALQVRKAITTLDASVSEVALLKVLSSGGLAPRTLLTVPVMQGDRAIGVLLAADRVGEEFFTYTDLRALDALAAGVARGVRERGLGLLPAPAVRAVAREDIVTAEPPVGWRPLPAQPARLRGPRFTHEGVAAALSAAVVFTALMLGATHLLGP